MSKGPSIAVTELLRFTDGRNRVLSGGLIVTDSSCLTAVGLLAITNPGKGHLSDWVVLLLPHPRC